MTNGRDFVRKNEKPLLIAGLRESYASSNEGIPAQWQRFAPHIGKVPGQLGNVAYGVVIEEDEGYAYLTGVGVHDIAHLPAGFSHLDLPARSYYVFSHEGHVSTLFETISRIMSDILPTLPDVAPPRRGEVGFLERYGENFDPAAGLGDIEIWVPAQGQLEAK